VRGIKDITVIAWAGDGGTYDIGLQALSGAAERGDDILYICYNNEAYMNTGIQRSGATPPRAWTKTTPKGKAEMKKNMPLIVAAHGASYVATASVSHPIDLARKVEKARDMERFRYIEILIPCPTGWNFPVDKTVEVAKLAVETLVWPLFEIEGGVLKINYKPREKRPLSEYLRLQKRFAHLTDEEVALLEGMFEERWRALLELEGKRVFV
ncbi:MAG: pyruvate synthase subunit beta, partial [Thermoproteota archaeon]